MINLALRPRAWLAIAFALSSAAAEEFSWQIAASIQETDPLGSDTDTAALEATYYFHAVDDEAGPLALAPFLSRSSRVTAAVRQLETEHTISYVTPVVGTIVSSEFTNETEVYTLAGRHVWRTPGWYVGGGLHRFSEPTSTRDGYSILGGKYLGRSTALELNFESTRWERNLTFPSLCYPPVFCSPPSAALNLDFETQDIGVSILHVGGKGRLKYSVSGSALESETTLDARGASTPLITVPNAPSRPYLPLPGAAIGSFETVDSASLGTVRIYSVAGELFPTRRLGVRLGYLESRGDSPQRERSEVAATWFFKRSIGIEFAVARSKVRFGRSASFDEDETMIRLIGRL